MSEVRKLSYINDMDKEVKYTGSNDTKMTKIRSINLFLLSLLLLLPLTNPQTQTQMDKTQVSTEISSNRLHRKTNNSYVFLNSSVCFY